MKQVCSTVDYDWLLRPTGDPFADVGGSVMGYLWERYPEMDVLELIEYMAKIYVDRWEGKINAFFLNSTITQPAFKGEVKIKETLEYFSSLIHETAHSETGFCRITGKKTKLFKAGRDNTLMSGSGTFVNFHHNFQQGMMLSKEMIIRMFFVPYGSQYVGGRVAIIHTNDIAVNDFFVKKNCQKNDDNIGQNLSIGVLKSEHVMPANALFCFVDDLFLRQLELIERRKDEDLALTLYHFTNFGASPEIVIYKLPTTVFRFYSTCQSAKLKKDWHLFLQAHYTNSKLKGAVYNSETSRYELARKGHVEAVVFADYSTWRNTVLENLVHGRSLLGQFFKWSIKHQFNFNIVQLYQKEVQNMKQETLNKIKELALFLTDAEKDVVKKTIRSLNGYKSAYELRRFFLRNVVEKNYRERSEVAKITLEDMVYYLFPDDVSWKDIRLLLLIAIYQELHAKNIWVEAETLPEDIDENMEE